MCVGICGSARISVTKVYGPTLSALRGGGCVKYPENSLGPLGLVFFTIRDSYSSLPFTVKSLGQIASA